MPVRGTVEPRPKLAEQPAIAAADFQDRFGLIGCQPLGHPLRPSAAGLLAFLFAKVIIAAAQCPILAGIGV